MATDHHNKHNNEKVEILWELPKWDTDTGTNNCCGGKTMPKELLGAGLPKNINWLKKKKKGEREDKKIQYLQSIVKQSTIKWGKVVYIWEKSSFSS